MKVAMLPAASSANPYIGLLRSAIEGQGAQVAPLTTGAALTGGIEIVHYHWPQNVVAQRGRVRGMRNALASLARIDWLRQRGARLVWTAHNLVAHEARDRGMEAWFMGQFVRRLDGVHYLDETSRDRAVEVFPRLARVPTAVIPHGLYGGAYPQGSGKAEARRRLGLQTDGAVVGFLGDIRDYKNLPAVLEVYEAASEPLPHLFIAGACREAGEAGEIARRVEALQAAGHAVTFREGRLADDEMLVAMSACDLALLPYQAGWNSGLAILCLEAGTPILASRLPIFQSLEREVGPAWLRTFEGPLAAHHIREAVEGVAGAPAGGRAGFMARRQWDAIGRDTVAFYREIAEIPRPPR